MRELHSDSHRLVDEVMTAGGAISIDEWTTRIGRFAALLLALCQPHAPSAEPSQEADMLTYALRLKCLADRHREKHYAAERLSEAVEDLSEHLQAVDEALGELHLHPDNVDASSALLGSGIAAASSCVTIVDARIALAAGTKEGQEPTAGVGPHEDLDAGEAIVGLANAFARVDPLITLFRELPSADQNSILEDAANNAGARASFGPESMLWKGSQDPKLARFLSDYAALTEREKDMALRGCAWFVADRADAGRDGPPQEVPLPHSSKLIAMFGTREDGLRAGKELWDQLGTQDEHEDDVGAQ